MRVVRGEVRDAYSRDGETVLMIDTTVMLLSPLASLIWESCDPAASIDDLVAVTVEAFGTPPDGDARSHVTTVLDALESAGAIRQV